MSFTIETWLGLSVLLNLVLITMMLGAARGRRLARPIEELSTDLKVAAAVLDEKSKAILREYGNTE